MDIREYERKTFTVNAVQLTLENVEEVAEWCKGTLDTEEVRLVGAITKLPCIRVKGQGTNKGQEATASLGHYVVELKGSFRVYKPTQFHAAFDEKRQPVKRVLSANMGDENYDGVVDGQTQVKDSHQAIYESAVEDAVSHEIAGMSEQQVQSRL